MVKVESDSQYRKRKNLIGGDDVQKPTLIHVILEDKGERDYLYELVNNSGSIRDEDVERLEPANGRKFWRMVKEMKELVGESPT